MNGICFGGALEATTAGGVWLTLAILLRRDQRKCGTRAERARRFRSGRRQQQLLVSRRGAIAEHQWPHGLPEVRELRQRGCCPAGQVRQIAP
jgi:hypothetical protein